MMIKTGGRQNIKRLFFNLGLIDNISWKKQKTKLSLLYKFALSLACLFVLNACTLAGITQKLASESDQSLPPFVVKEIKLGHIFVEKKDGEDPHFIVKLQACVKQRHREGSPIRNVRYNITYKTNFSDGQFIHPAEDKKLENVEPDPDGCIQWEEVYTYDYVNHPPWLGLNRTITLNPNSSFAGSMIVPLAINPWLTDSDKGKPAVLDIRPGYSKNHPLLAKEGRFKSDGLAFLSRNRVALENSLVTSSGGEVSSDAVAATVNQNTDNGSVSAGLSDTKQVLQENVDDSNTETKTVDDSEKRQEIQFNNVPTLWVPDIELQITDKPSDLGSTEGKQDLHTYLERCTRDNYPNCFKRDLNLHVTIPGLKQMKYDTNGKPAPEELSEGKYDFTVQLILVPRGHSISSDGEQKGNYRIHEQLCKGTLDATDKKFLTFPCDLQILYMSRVRDYKLLLEIKSSDPSKNRFKKFHGVYKLDDNFIKNYKGLGIAPDLNDVYKSVLKEDKTADVIGSMNVQSILDHPEINTMQDLRLEATVDGFYVPMPFVVEEVTQDKDINPQFKDGKVHKFTVYLQACIKDPLKNNIPITGQEFFITYKTNLEDDNKTLANTFKDKEVKASNLGSSGCIKWQEGYYYQPVSEHDSYWLGLERRISTTGIYAGTQNIRLAVNPWLQKSDSNNPVLDLRPQYYANHQNITSNMYIKDGLEYLSQFKETSEDVIANQPESNNVSQTDEEQTLTYSGGMQWTKPETSTHIKDKDRFPQLWVNEIKMQTKPVPSLLKDTSETSGVENSCEDKENETEKKVCEDSKIRRLLEVYQTPCKKDNYPNCYRRHLKLNLDIPIFYFVEDSNGEASDPEPLRRGIYDIGVQLILTPTEDTTRSFSLHEICRVEKKLVLNNVLNFQCIVEIPYIRKVSIYNLLLEVKRIDKPSFKRFRGIYGLSENFSKEEKRFPISHDQSEQDHNLLYHSILKIQEEIDEGEIKIFGDKNIVYVLDYLEEMEKKAGSAGKQPLLMCLLTQE